VIVESTSKFFKIRQKQKQNKKKGQDVRELISDRNFKNHYDQTVSKRELENKKKIN